MTEYRHTYQVTWEMYDTARRAYRGRRLLAGALFAGAFLAACAFAYNTDDLVIQGMAMTGFVMLLVFYLVVWFRVRYIQDAVARLFIGVTVELMVNEDGLRTRSDGRDTYRAWRFVRRVLAGPQIWVVFWKPPDPPLILAASAFEGAAAAFALERARAVGARVSDRRPQ